MSYIQSMPGWKKSTEEQLDFLVTGTSLKPKPPIESKHKDVRYLDLYENDEIDIKTLSKWINQASKIPGWMAK